MKSLPGAKATSTQQHKPPERGHAPKLRGRRERLPHLQAPQALAAPFMAEIHG